MLKAPLDQVCYESKLYSLVKFYQPLPSYGRNPYRADCNALYPVRKRFRDYF
jgi:hypothetical protein